MANSATIASGYCADLVVPSSVIWRKGIPSSDLQAAASHLVLVPSVVDEPSVNHVLAKCCDHPISPHGTMLPVWGEGSGLGIGIMGNWAITSFWEGTDPFAITFWSQWNSERSHFHCNTFPSIVKPTKDSAFEQTQSIIITDVLMTRVVGND